MHDSVQESELKEGLKSSAQESFHSGSRFSYKPLSQWDCLAPHRLPTDTLLLSKPATNKNAVAYSSTVEPNRFQRFIRRIENAGPKIVLDRITEDWYGLPDEEFDEEVSLLPPGMFTAD